MTPAEKQRSLIEDFAIIEDAQERLAAVVDRARRKPALPESDRTEANRVRGCQSQVWVVSTLRPDGTLHLRYDSDSPLVKGLVALICDLYDGGRPADVFQTEPTILDELHLQRDLSPTRRNGLAAVRAHIRDTAERAMDQGGGEE